MVVTAELAYRALAALAGVVLALAALTFASAPAAAGDIVLEAGDSIAVTVHGHDDLSGDYDLDADGRLSFPLVGVLALDGLTPRQAASAIENRLKPDYLVRPQVSVRSLGHRPFFILGEVKTPGRYDYEPGLTVMEAVAMAGGYTGRARSDTLYVIRRSDPDKRRQEAQETTRIKPGDMIRVPERFF